LFIKEKEKEKKKEKKSFLFKEGYLRVVAFGEMIVF